MAKIKLKDINSDEICFFIQAVRETQYTSFLTLQSFTTNLGLSLMLIIFFPFFLKNLLEFPSELDLNYKHTHTELALLLVSTHYFEVDHLYMLDYLHYFQ